MSSKRVARWSGLSVAAIFTLAAISGVPGYRASADQVPPQPKTAAEAKVLVDQLDSQRTDLRNQFQQLSVRASEAASKIDAKNQEIAKQQKRVDTLKTQISQIALLQFQNRDVDTASEIIIAKDPAAFISRMGTMEKVQSDKAKLLKDFQNEQASLAQAKREIETAKAQTEADAAAMDKIDAQSKTKLDQAKRIAEGLDAAERAKLERERPAVQPNTDQTPVKPNIKPSGGNNYAFGNCTWYAYERRLQLGRPVGGSWGNANAWASNGRAAGYRVDNVPEVGAVMVSFIGWAGHVAIVERVNSDGSVFISEMNWNGGFNRVSNRTVVGAGLYSYVH